jgi:hypothetical protein
MCLLMKKKEFLLSKNKVDTEGMFLAGKSY